MILKSYKTFLLAIAVLVVSACETLNLDLQENPDALTLESADVDLIFNNVQFAFRNQVQGLGFTTDNLMRLVNQFGTYNPGQGTMNGSWSTIYNTGTQIDGLRVFAERDGFTYHLGAAQIMQATMYLNVVDFIGTAVFSEANQPEEFPNPGLDPGADVYAGITALLDEGIANMQAGGRAPVKDFFYNGDADGWVKYANTVKLRMAVQARLVDAGNSTTTINNLIAGGNLIDETAEDLQFNYGTVGPPVESRHPLFTGNYINGAGVYQSNNLMSYMKDSMAAPDPRLRYYFYRQTNRDLPNTNPDLVPCLGDPQYDFCYIGDLYFGRDHADNEGIPGDQNLRTAYGAYPLGGQYDDDQFVAAFETGAVGDGFTPMHLSTWTHFMLAEAALTLGTTGAPETYLETGIRQHMAKVAAFSPANMTTAQVDDYVAEVLAEYAAASADERLDIIMREWWISSFSTGLLPFNNFRRTSYPSVLQAPVIAAGPFIRSYFLPESELNSNTNPDFAEQKQITDRVFWDNNPESGWVY